ncbi:uncharacterized protein LOC111233798 [Seriola dumerili]|uniref:uncharacterized protein LOC111233798 n=1 Tax=Seriola dumerili TaxID=41447 RepID=UPI000BBE4542|nr:uncharacterized protein LOC111233798 [Seriola dumerili]
MAGNFQWKCLSSVFSAGVFIAGCTILLVTAFPLVQITIGAVYMYECPAAPVIPVYVLLFGILALLVMGLFALPKFLCAAASGSRIWTVCNLSLVLFAFIWFFYGSYQVYSVYPPNYNKNITSQSTVNTSIYPPTAPDNKLGLILQNWNQSRPNLNHTKMINDKQTSRKLIQTLASSKTNREHLNAPQARRVTTVVPYCDRTMYLFAFWTTTLVYAIAGNTLVMILCLYGFMKITSKITELLTT